MKFLKNNFYTNYFCDNNENVFNELYFDYFLYDFDKFFISNRKNNSLYRKGIIKNLKNCSKIRDANYSLEQKYIKIAQKNGKSFFIFNSLNLVMFNFYNYFFNVNNSENLDLNNNKLHNLNYFNNLISNDFSKLDLNFLIKNLLVDYNLIFEIKSKKNTKKKKNEKNTKYIYEIFYIKKNKRYKYLLRSLIFFLNHFKKNLFWERSFWSFFISFLNTKNSFLNNKKLFIYTKSIKFFKKSKK